MHTVHAIGMVYTLERTIGLIVVSRAPDPSPGGRRALRCRVRPPAWR